MALLPVGFQQHPWKLSGAGYPQGTAAGEFIRFGRRGSRIPVVGRRWHEGCFLASRCWHA